MDSFDLFQQFDLYDQRRRDTQLEDRSRKDESELEMLRRHVEKMALVHQALYDLLKGRLGITDEELRRKVRELDRGDGAEDGKLSAEPVVCPKCKTTLTAGALNCYSCGATIAPALPFEP